MSSAPQRAPTMSPATKQPLAPGMTHDPTVSPVGSAPGPSGCYTDPPACGDTQACQEQGAGGGSAGFTCSCVLPEDGEDKDGGPADCQPWEGKFVWKWMGFKFRAKWKAVKKGGQWALKFTRTIRLPLFGIKGPKLKIQITYLCPLDENGRKPTPGTPEAAECFKPDSTSAAWKWGRRSVPLAESAAEYDELVAGGDSNGVFIEIGAAGKTVEDVDATLSAIQEDLKLGTNGRMGNRGNAPDDELSNNALLIIDSIPIGNGDRFFDTSSLHDDTDPDLTTQLAAWDECSLGGTDCPPPPKPEEEEEESSTYWIIAVVAGVGIVGLVGLYAMRSKRNKAPNDGGLAELKEDKELEGITADDSPQGEYAASPAPADDPGASRTGTAPAASADPPPPALPPGGRGRVRQGSAPPPAQKHVSPRIPQTMNVIGHGRI